MSNLPQDLVDAAIAVRAKAYAPYSNFPVGAAVRSAEGGIFAGCNVENAAYAQVSCAEAGAISAMIASGGRRIAAIAVAGGDKSSTCACTPCGGCRQRIHEFSDENTRIIVEDDDSERHTYTMAELLPSSFHLPR